MYTHTHIYITESFGCTGVINTRVINNIVNQPCFRKKYTVKEYNEMTMKR